MKKQWILGAIALFLVTGLSELYALEYEDKNRLYSLQAEKKIYSQGEPIRWFYCYGQKYTESIKDERWWYEEADGKWHLLHQRPTRLFIEGRHRIGLQIQDQEGRWSEKRCTQIRIKGSEIHKEYKVLAKENQIGSCVENLEDINFRVYPAIKEVHKTLEKGQLILSNSPEVVTDEGILYESQIQKKGRLFYHHIGQFSNKKQIFEIVVTNLENQSAHVYWTKKTEKGPNPHVVYTGQKAAIDYLNADQETSFILEPGESRVILRLSHWGQGTVLSGMMDFDTDKPLNLKVQTYTKSHKKNNLQYLKKDKHPRGTFDALSQEYNLSYDQGEICQMVLGNPEQWLQGKDEVLNEKVINKGNYGVIYKINIKSDQTIGLFLNPRGDMFQGVIQWQGQRAHCIPSKGNLVNQRKLVYIGQVKQGEQNQLSYMLPSGSAAPVLLVLIPLDK